MEKKSGVRKKIADMSLSGSGIRDIARVPEISPDTVMNELKRKEKLLRKVNPELPDSMEPSENTSVVISEADEAEADEMRSFVESRANQRWLRNAADHKTGKILAHTFGKREDEVFAELRGLPGPFGIKKFHTDGSVTYDRKADCECHEVGRRNTQKTERRHLTLRTGTKRLARKTVCFSELEKMHDIVIGLFIDRYEFGVAI